MSSSQNNHVRVFGPKVFDPSLARKILAAGEEMELGYGVEGGRGVGEFEAAGMARGHGKAKKRSESKRSMGFDAGNGRCRGDEELEVEEEEEEEDDEEEEHNFFNHMQEVLTQLSFERTQKEHCLSKLKDIENQLEQFSHDFFTKLKDLRTKVDI